MKHLNNKQINYNYYKYLHGFTKENIYKAYSKPSHDKIKTWENCIKICNSLSGENLQILSHNTYQFTAGFIGYYDNYRIFVYITKDNTYFKYI